MSTMKNIDKEKVLVLRDEVEYMPGKVISKTLSQNENVSVTIFSFDKDEEISSHAAGGDAMITCLEGVGRITINGTDYIVNQGESIVMPQGLPHAVYAQEQFKMLLIVVFPTK